MNIAQLQYLVDVGELGSFTNAAKKNYMTVPAISQSINQLEAELDVTLFLRLRKGTIPTIEGKKVIQNAVTILKTVEKMKNEIDLLKSGNQGNIVIATIPGVSSQVISTIIEFRKNFPFVNIEMIEGDSTLVLNQVKNSHADIGFLSSSICNREESLIWEPVMQGECILVANKNYPLRFKKSISGNELGDEMIVLYDDPYLKKIAKDLLPENSFNRIALFTNNIEGLFQMVVYENAVTIGADYIVNSLPAHIRDEVITIPLNKYKTTPYYLWKIARKNEKVSEIIEQFTHQLLFNLK